MSYIFTKLVSGKFRYYLDQYGRWNGLKDNAKLHKDYEMLSPRLLKLREKELRGTIDYIDL